MKKGDTVFNKLTGERATVRGVWFNVYSGRTVVTAQPDGAARCDWEMWDFDNVSTEPLPVAVEVVQVLDEVIVTDGTDEFAAVVLVIREDSVLVALADYEGEYVTLDKRSIVRNITRENEKAA